MKYLLIFTRISNQLTKRIDFVEVTLFLWYL